MKKFNALIVHHPHPPIVNLPKPKSKAEGILLAIETHIARNEDSRKDDYPNHKEKKPISKHLLKSASCLKMKDTAALEVLHTEEGSYLD